MLTFATEFPIDDETGLVNVLLLARAWLAGFPRSPLRFQDIEFGIAPGARFDKAVGGEQLELARAADDALAGFRYRRVEESGIAWTTTLVAGKTGSQALLSLRVERDVPAGAAEPPAPNKPNLVKQALRSLRGGMDGSLLVTSQPHRLPPDESAALIAGQGSHRLPVVSVAQGADALAERLAGMAHVLADSSQQGATLSWPGEAPQAYAPARDLPARIAENIRAALLSHRHACTWP